jgi:hypothetical protein
MTTELPALSVRQPFADLIVRGVKDIENRTKAWRLRGRVLIHASATFGGAERDAANEYRRELGLKKGEEYRPALGAVVGEVDIVDAVDDHPSDWFEGPIGYVLRNARRYQPAVSFKGAVGIFYVPAEVLQASRPSPEPAPLPVKPKRVEVDRMSRASQAGTATIPSRVGGAIPTLRTDGACLTGTVAALGDGSRPMSAESLAKIRGDALDLLGQVTQVYVNNVATDEIGAKGTARASASVPTKPSTGLLYGRIQSGKTVAMIALVAAAIDNGFRVIVVLTSDNVKLVSQTKDRFSVLHDVLALDALNPGEWVNDHQHIAKHLGTTGLLFVCSKNKDRLDGLIEFLEKIHAPGFPALILDDEADQATLDANVGRRVRDRDKGKKGTVDPTAIHARVVDGLRQSLPHHVFLQVTATPYALLLQSVGEQLRPSFVRLLEPGAGYTGGEKFFEADQVEHERPPLVFVSPDESQTIVDGTDQAPDGLRDAIAFFLVAAAVQAVSDPETARAGQNFLCHTSQLKVQHKNLEELIRGYVDRVGDHLSKGKGEAFDRVQGAYARLCTTMPEAPPSADVFASIARKLVLRKIMVVNAEGAPEFSKGMNFVIGGNILGRGVTIENLLVTYYLRQPKTAQMDTMLQHARMYGYRERLMKLTRVFLPQQLAVRFHEIHLIEQRLRKHVAGADLNKPILVGRANGLKPTRRSVLDPTYMDAFDGGQQIYPHYPKVDLSTAQFQEISQRVHELYGDMRSGRSQGPPRLVTITFEQLQELVALFPYDDSQDSSSWLPTVLQRVVERQAERCKGRAYLYARNMSRGRHALPTGALNGEERDYLTGRDGPVFCAFRDDGSQMKFVKASAFWYPTLVLDQGTPSVLVNTSEDN